MLLLLLASRPGLWAAVHYVNIQNTSPAAPYSTWASAATSIQEAVDVATPGDLVLVSNGVYRTGARVIHYPFENAHSNGVAIVSNRLVISKAVTVRSLCGPRSTILDGAGAVRCVYLTNGAVLSGFTLTRGNAINGLGGGALCDSREAVLTNCVLVGNLAEYGGGAESGTLNNCEITGNSATSGYGGVCLSSLNNCILTGNSARWGGGCAAMLTNCTVVGNRASDEGGGAWDSILNNCIVYSNTAPKSANYDATYSFLNFCCTTPLPTSGTGNFTTPPQLVDLKTAQPNLRLQSGSPCINAGWNGCVTTSRDLDGNPRIAEGTVDVGAYEFGAPAKPTGSLEVTLTPPSAVAAGAAWQVDFGPWQASGARVSGLEVGLHTIGFKTAEGWLAPTEQFVTIETHQQLSVTYVSVTEGALRVEGNGTIRPNLMGQRLRTGTRYTVTAVPAAGYVFAGWTGTSVSRNPKLTFTAQPDTAAVANFVPNPFPAVAGTFAGLFYEADKLTPPSCGLVRLQLTKGGALSGCLRLSGTNYCLSGRLLGDGTYFNSIVRTQGTPLVVQLQLNLADGETMTGTLSQGSWLAKVVANRTVYSPGHRAPQAGRYTLALAGADDPQNLPAGDGAAAIQVSPQGDVLIHGSLGDGTKLTAGSRVSNRGEWPLYAAPYAGKGVLIGWLTFTNDLASQSDLEGVVGWMKPPQKGTKCYPNGFSWPLVDGAKNAFGSAYTNQFPLLGWSNGVLVLEYGNLSQQLANPVSLSGDQGVGANHLQLKITSHSGRLQGSLIKPDTNRRLTFHGVLLQKRDTGNGFFIGTSQSGRVGLHQ